MGLLWPDLLSFFALSVLLVLVYVRSRLMNIHKIYVALHFATLFWPLGHFVSLSADDPAFRTYGMQLAVIAFCFVGPGWLLLIQCLIRPGWRPTWRNAAMFVPALLCAAFVLWNPGGALVTPGETAGAWNYGYLFWGLVAVLFSYFAYSMYRLFQALVRDANVHRRRQWFLPLLGMILLAGAGGLDLMFNVFLQGRMPEVEGLTSLGLLAAVPCFTQTIRRLEGSDLLSLARRDIFEFIDTGILVLDANGRILESNRGSQAFVRVKKGELFDLEAFLAPFETQGEVSEFLYRFRHYPSERMQIEISIRNGGLRHVNIQIAPILDDRREVIGRVITFHDVTDLRKLVDDLNRKNETLHERNLELIRTQEELFNANRKLEQMAITDSLTGCYNRRYLMQKLEKEVMDHIRNKVPFSIVLFDIDHFKRINDQYGHLVGDQVLIATVDAVRGVLRPADVLARYGGEEFTIYLPGTRSREAEELARGIMRAVSEIAADVGNEVATIRVTVSIGIVSSENYEKPVEEVRDFLRGLFARADAALYKAKNGGRNRVVVANGMR
ncbi:MAG: hypothetical protein BAA02_05500 [Paenibacillaceae bacterium ZCTH02-B3]|nr:MAG: hypothetical protein BAA02_05500 [Paenibacillaceae bacterium ZCTH02-B3]